MINLNNYETFAMDYLEGNLNAKLKAEMDAFLSNHPEIKSDLELLSDPIHMLPDESITYNNKLSLYRNEESPVIKLFRTNFVKMGIAASLFLAVAAYFVINNNQTTSSDLVNIIEHKDHLPSLAESHNGNDRSEKDADEFVAQINQNEGTGIQTNANPKDLLAKNEIIAKPQVKYNHSPKSLENNDANNSFQDPEVSASELLAVNKPVRTHATIASLETKPFSSIAISEPEELKMVLPAVDRISLNKFQLDRGIAKLEQYGLWSETVDEVVNIQNVKSSLMPEGTEEVVAFQDVTSTKTFQTYLTDLKDALLPESVTSVFNK